MFNSTDILTINAFADYCQSFFGIDSPLRIAAFESLDGRNVWIDQSKASQWEMVTIPSLSIDITKEENQFVFTYEDFSTATFDNLADPLFAILAKVLKETFVKQLKNEDFESAPEDEEDEEDDFAY